MGCVARGGTPAIQALEAAGVWFDVQEFHHEPGERNYGLSAAEALGVEPEHHKPMNGNAHFTGHWAPPFGVQPVPLRAKPKGW